MENETGENPLSGNYTGILCGLDVAQNHEGWSPFVLASAGELFFQEIFFSVKWFYDNT